MGQEKVFLFLFDKYYSKGDTAWLNQNKGSLFLIVPIA
jgi:hypothetical protein